MKIHQCKNGEEQRREVNINQAKDPSQRWPRKAKIVIGGEKENLVIMPIEGGTKEKGPCRLRETDRKSMALNQTKKSIQD